MDAGPVVGIDDETTQRVLEWGDRARRDLPWRRSRDPWAVLVSEVMLQQTRADRVTQRWERFLRRWPDVASFAAADLADVLAEWSGLGYPRRARFLHLAARQMVAEHDGEVPDSLDALLALPGIGAYTARAVLAFSYEREVAIVDTNVGRILARFVGRRLRPSDAQRIADEMSAPAQSWRWNQAMLDIGAGHCRPEPRCDGCPLGQACRWSGSGRPVPDPALRSAGVSRPQPRFEGSDRQARGILLRSLQAGDLRGESVLDTLGWDDDAGTRERSDRIVRSLVADGLISQGADGRLCLGDHPAGPQPD